jgi:hypothetical protein
MVVEDRARRLLPGAGSPSPQRALQRRAKVGPIGAASQLGLPSGCGIDLNKHSRNRMLLTIDALIDRKRSSRKKKRSSMGALSESRTN